MNTGRLARKYVKIREKSPVRSALQPTTERVAPRGGPDGGHDGPEGAPEAHGSQLRAPGVLQLGTNAAVGV